jgi:CRP-like cAMP-binding protein
MDIHCAESGFLLEKGTVLTAEQISRLRTESIETLWIDTEANIEEILRKRIHSVKLNRKTYEKGEFICLQGDPSNEFYILLEGELEVILVDEHRLSESPTRKSREELINNCGKSIATLSGRLINFGEMGPLLGQNRTATIRAKSRAVVQSIPASGEGFSHTILQNPELGLNVAITISKRLYDTINGIEKYDKILFQLNSISNSINRIYEKVLTELQKRHESSGDLILKNVYQRFSRQSVLMERRNPPEPFRPIGPGLQNTSVLSEKDPVFADLQLNLMPTGMTLPLQDEENDYIYLLFDGEITIFNQELIVQTMGQRGDIIGLIKALSFLEMNYRRIGDNPFNAKVTKEARVLCIASTQLQKSATTHKALILHICRILAEKLKNYHRRQTESFARIEDHFNILSYGEKSYINELKNILGYFFENQQWFAICLKEILALKETLDKTESDFMHLKDCVKISFANPFAMPMLKLGSHD